MTETKVKIGHPFFELIDKRNLIVLFNGLSYSNAK